MKEESLATSRSTNILTLMELISNAKYQVVKGKVESDRCYIEHVINITKIVQI